MVLPSAVNSSFLDLYQSKNGEHGTCMKQSDDGCDLHCRMLADIGQQNLVGIAFGQLFAWEAREQSAIVADDSNVKFGPS